MVAIGPDERVEDLEKLGFSKEYEVMLGPRMGCMLIGPGDGETIYTCSSSKVADSAGTLPRGRVR